MKLARQQIDAQLVASGWVIQDYRQFNPTAGRGIALRKPTGNELPRFPIKLNLTPVA
jgi:type I restriction enzyme R subunit